ncbi:MAG: hypothetical protein LBM99_02980 [Bacillales bacterium]|jgi:predicted bacteriocin transport accessory protein|nr:hypothetical protein [Bacillales bacterium]
MKKLILLSLLLVGCASNGITFLYLREGEEKIRVEYLENAGGTVELVKEDVDLMFTNNETFILYNYSETCPHCQNFKPILNSVIIDIDIKIYAVSTDELMGKNEYYEFKSIPNIAVIIEGEFFRNINPNVFAKMFTDFNILKRFFVDNFIWEPID